MQERLREKLVALERVRQEIAAWEAQRIQMEQKVRELDLTIKELEGLGKGSEIYRQVGEILVKVEDPEKLREDLKEEKELMEVRLEAIKKQLANLEKKGKELEAELRDLLQQTGSGGSRAQSA